MKVTFEEITSKGLHKLFKDSRMFSGYEMVFIIPPTADVALALRDKNTATLDGDIRATVDMSCGRCGRSVAYELFSKYNYLFKVGNDSSLLHRETECSAEDCYTVYLEEPVIDLAMILQEQLTLSIPGKLLCSEDCKGLCHNCGELLDSGPCNCVDKSNDSPFAVLKNLKR